MDDEQKTPDIDPETPVPTPTKKASRNVRNAQRPKLPGMNSPQPGCSRNFMWIVAVLIGFVALSYIYNPNRNEVKTVPVSEVSAKVAGGQVEKIQVINDTDLVVTLKDGSEVKSAIRSGDTLNDYGITPDKVQIAINNSSTGNTLLYLAIQLLPALIIVGLIFYMFRATAGSNMKAMNFGQSKAKLANVSKTRFKDVAGLKEAKTELLEEVEFLRNPGKFRSLGAEIPKGVLLIGPPGTGKTLLAKAVAGEAGVPFFTISASEFVEMFVGVGASRVRDLFAKAKKSSPCIIFIDELDAIGRQRGSGMGGGHDEREQTLNQILVEMDGFDTDSGVIVMAATNRPDVLDAALLRPGRFDRRVTVDLPTKEERVEVLKIYANKKPLAKNIDLQAVASQTAGLSPADLKNVMNEAAILTARNDLKEISQAILHEAVEKVLVGPERPSRVLAEQEKKITAVHEAGHAIVGHVLPHTDDIHKVSIISRGQALGLTWSLPKEDRHLVSRSKFEDELAMLLGGRLAEIMYYNEPTTGASNDLQRATKIAEQMVTTYGMSDKLGLRTYGDRETPMFLGRNMGTERDFSEESARTIDAEITRIIEDAEKKATEVLTKYRKALDKLTDLLLEKETVTGEELTHLLELETGVAKPQTDASNVRV